MYAYIGKYICNINVLQIKYEVFIHNTGDSIGQSHNISHGWEHQSASLVVFAPYNANKYVNPIYLVQRLLTDFIKCVFGRFIPIP